MKDNRDVIKEYGYTLKWTNGGDEIFGPEKEDGTFDVIGFTGYRFYLENEHFEQTEITNQKALDFIKAKTTNAFRRKSNLFVYDAYVKLFEILGIEKKKTFKELMEEKGYNGNRLSIKSGVPVMSINDLKNGNVEFKNIKIENVFKLAKAFEMTIDELYNELT